MKKSIFILIIFFSIVLIYVKFRDNEINFLVLGNKIDSELDSLLINYLIDNNKYGEYISIFTGNNMRTTDLINDIKNNKKIGNYTLNNAIIKADIILLNIGYYDYVNYLNKGLISDNILNLKNDMDILLKALRNISKEKIILIGIENNMDILELNLINNVYKNVCVDNNITYIENINLSYSDMLNNLLKEI